MTVLPRDEWLHSLALQAAIYAWPLYEMRRMWAATSRLKTLAEGASGEGADARQRWCNTFRHTRALVKAGGSRVVMPNNDTLYTNAWLDLSDGPLVISVPEMGERYYVLGFLDFFTNPFGHVGSRTTGPSAGQVFITGPGWSGETPAEFRAPGRHLRSATPWVWIIGRILVDGEADIANVAALQADFRIQTLADAQAGRSTPPRGFLADCDERTPLDVASFVVQVNAALTANPAPATDAALLGLLAQVGIGVAADQAQALLGDAAVNRAWERALATARALLDKSAEAVEGLQGDGPTNHGPPRAGWSNAISVPGEDFGFRFLRRAFVARQSIGMLAPAEALYPRCETDADGQPLNGRQRYAIRFAPGRLPPVDAFWSITLYSLRDYMLVANSIDRYAIGDRTRGLVRDADGGLTLTLQHAPPQDAKARANWLPTPEDAFFLCLRAYRPRQEMLDGRYELPAPQRMT